MIYQYIINAVLIFFCSQKIASSNFWLKKNGNYIKNIICILFFEELVSAIVILFNYFFKLNKEEYIEIIVLIISMTFFFFLSVACYYIHEFRGTNLNFQDLMSIPTAKEVAGGYNIKIYPRFIVVAIIYILYIFYKVRNVDNLLNDKHIYIKSFFVAMYVYAGNFTMLLFSFLYLLSEIFNNPYDYGLFSGEKEGYIYNFFSSIPIFHISIKNDAEEYVYSEYIKNKKLYIDNNKMVVDDIDEPYVICIMNESFGTSHRLIKTDKDVTPYYDGLRGVIKGNMYVNTIGGGTCNTEYDFLTYSNVGDCSYPIYPFNNLVKNNMYALPRYFKNYGYKTLAFHPYTKTNYNRHLVYDRFGFDEFINIDDMKDKEYVRNFISDESMYKTVLEKLDESIHKKEKLFFYGVSIQNHGGYNSFENENIKCVDERFKEIEIIESYLSLMKISDDAIHILIDYIKNVQERVVLLFFGDHNATYSTNINRIIYGEDGIYEMGDAYKVPFFIYDNKNCYDKFIDRISPNFLAAELIKVIGMPLDYDLYYMDKIHESIDCMNYHRMYKKSDDNIHLIDNYEYKILQKYFVLKNKSRL